MTPAQSLLLSSHDTDTGRFWHQLQGSLPLWWHQPGILEFNLIPTLSSWRQRRVPQAEGSVPKIAPVSLRCQSPPQIAHRLPTTASWHSVTHRTQEKAYVSQFIMKDLGRVEMKRCMGLGSGEGTEFPLLSGHHLPGPLPFLGLCGDSIAEAELNADSHSVWLHRARDPVLTWRACCSELSLLPARCPD